MPQEPQYILQDSDGTDLGVVYANDDGNLVLHHAGSGDEVILRDGGLYNAPANGTESKIGVRDGTYVVGEQDADFDTIQAGIDALGTGMGAVHVRDDYDPSEEEWPVRIRYSGQAVRGMGMTEISTSVNDVLFHVSTTEEAVDGTAGIDSNRPPGVLIEGFDLTHTGDERTIVNRGTKHLCVRDVTINKGGNDTADAIYIDEGPEQSASDATDDNPTPLSPNTARFERVKVFNVGGSGLNSLRKQHAVSIDSCTFLDCDEWGLRINGPASPAVVNTVVEDCGKPGMMIRRCESPWVSGIYAEANARDPGGYDAAEILLAGNTAGGYVGGIYGNGKGLNDHTIAVTDETADMQIGPIFARDHASSAVHFAQTGDNVDVVRSAISLDSTPEKLTHDTAVSIGRVRDQGVLIGYDDHVGSVDLSTVSPQWVGDVAIANADTPNVNGGVLCGSNTESWVCPTEVDWINPDDYS